MKKRTYILITFFAIISSAGAMAQLNLSRIFSAGAKTLQAITISDAQIESHVKEFIKASDTTNKLCAADDPYSIRMEKIVDGINNRDGLNIKVYRATDVNAFACADGSIRVYSGLMDIMSDDEILGVVGHEIGHIKNKDTKDAFRTALLSSALRDGIASTGDVAAKLSDSQLGKVSDALVNSRYSQKQEYAADNYGYEFLKSHGKNPWAMALSFEKLREMEKKMGGDKSNKVQQLFSTHPNIEMRTKKMQERAAKDGYAKPETTQNTQESK